MDQPTPPGFPRRAIRYLLPFLVWGGFTFLSFLFVFRHVDMKPRVSDNFFFANNDPELRSDRKIARMFEQEQQVVLSAAGELDSPAYLARLTALTDALSAVPGVHTVQSLTHGPRKIAKARESPLWSRVLFSGDRKSSFIYVFLKKEASRERSVGGIERAAKRFEGPGFRIIISGAPYIVELIRRSLGRDLKVFSLIAVGVFGLSSLLISRSVPMVVGTLISCANASAFTLILTHEAGIPVGPLTANLSTIVFVLTLTHMVFMTFNLRHIVRTEGRGPGAWRKAVRVTLLPSSWSMATALTGFLSLLLVPSEPLRQLGMSGAIGAVTAFLAAYVVYPFFLSVQSPEGKEKEPDTGGTPPAGGFLSKKHGWIVAVIVLAAGVASLGLPALNTEPGLFSYFKKGGEIRNSLEYIDRNGGSAPLSIVLANPDGSPLKMKEAYPRLWELQNALEKDPAVGSVISLPLFLAEAKHYPFGFLFPIGWILKIIERPSLGIARYYLTQDETKTLFIIRMKETYRGADHLTNVDRVKRIARSKGFEPVLTGGIYLLYGKMSKLVASSLVEGLAVLIGLFILMGGLISRSFRVVGAMVISLVMIPCLMLGALGYFRVPVDIISAPAPNIAIGIGVDAMIHMLIWVRRHPEGIRSWEAWAAVRARLSKPILYSMTVVSAGFAIFLFSSFPPTQRFGLSVVIGTLLSPLPALFVLPWFSTVFLRPDRT